MNHASTFSGTLHSSLGTPASCCPAVLSLSHRCCPLQPHSVPVAADRCRSPARILETVPDEWRARLGWNSLSHQWRVVIAEFGLHMFTLGMGKSEVTDIDQIKYDGRLVILNNGSRGQVESYDADTVDLWSPMTTVLVHDGVMYNLDDAEHVDVTEDL